jgi:hypothetical protein
VVSEELSAPADGRPRPFARNVADRVVFGFPDCAEHVAWDENGELDLHVPCPSPAAAQGLWVGTDSERDDVWVGFHTFHWHFQDWTHAGTDEFLDDAIGFMRDLMEERLVVVTVNGWGSWVGEPAEALADLPRRAKRVQGAYGRMLRLVGLARRPRKATIRSWLGTCDADIEDVYSL